MKIQYIVHKSNNTISESWIKKFYTKMEIIVFISGLLSFVPDWNKVNEELASGTMDEYEYQAWLEDALRLLYVVIDDYMVII